MTDNPRIEELRRRVQKDPTSIAFAQLAEEYRRVGDYQEAVNVCRAGLARHPAYLSARVTLGRALMELEQYSDAQAELESVLDLAPDNLAAIRALAEIHQRRGEFGEAFKQYSSALDVARVEAPPAAAAPAEQAETAAAFADAVEVADALTVHVDVQPPPAAAPAEQPPPAEPAADDPFAALGALTLDLPPLPEFSLDVPLSGLSLDVSPDPVLADLESWLAAIVADRSQQR